MPELRLVVLATQEKLGFGQTFGEAMISLFGQTAPQTSEAKPAPEQPSTQGSQPQAPTPLPATQNLSQLVNQALQEFEEYQRLTAQGKFAEAGQRLEQHKRTLEEIKKLTAKQ